MEVVFHPYSLLNNEPQLRLPRLGDLGGSGKVFRTRDKLQTLPLREVWWWLPGLWVSQLAPFLPTQVLTTWTAGLRDPHLLPGGSQPWLRECSQLPKSHVSPSCLEWQFAVPILALRVRAYAQKLECLGSDPDSSP